MPNFSNAQQSSSSDGISYSLEITKVLNALNELLDYMLKKDEILETPNVYIPKTNKQTLEDILQLIYAGKAYDLRQLNIGGLYDLTKFLLRQLRVNGQSILVSEKLNETTVSSIKDFNQDPLIQDILEKFFKLLARIANSSEINQMDSYNLACFFAPSLFSEGGNKGLQIKKVKKLIEGNETYINASNLDSQSSSSDGILYSPEITKVLNALNELLDYMLKKDEILKTQGVFRISADKNTLDTAVKSIYDGQPYDLRKLTIFGLCDLTKRLLGKLKINGQSIFFSNAVNEATALDLIDFNQDPLIQGILEKLFTLLARIANSSDINKMSAENLARCIASNLFSEIDLAQHQILDSVGVLVDLQNQKIKQIIEKKQENVTDLNSQSSSTSSILSGLNSVPQQTAPYTPVLVLDNPGTDSKTQSRGFFARHLAKLLITPSLGLFAAGLTVALMIAFPPAGIGLGAFIGISIAAGVVGLGVGFVASALVDQARTKEYALKRFYYEGCQTIGKPTNFRQPVRGLPRVNTDLDANEHEENGLSGDDSPSPDSDSDSPSL